jgi:general transcription factor 3C polypeptide 3 (transcription factor C subunit 4)
LFREMKLADTAVRTPEVLKWNALNKRYAPTSQVKTEPGADADDDAEDAEGVEKDGPGAGVGATVEIPTKNNPIIVAIYGQICIAAKSYQSAICGFLVDRRFGHVADLMIVYLLHAYDYCPNDPMVCLCLAIASIGRAMQRQSDNRHHLVTQVGRAHSVVKS